MFVGTDCPIPATPDPRNLSRSPFCTLCDGSLSAAPTASPIALAAGFTGQAFTSTNELVDAVDQYMLESSSDSNVVTTYGRPIGNWNVSQIRDFNNLFDSGRNQDMSRFDFDLSGWDVSSAETMRQMFRGTVSFQDARNGLSDWNVARVTDMSGMFDSSAFAGNISKWQVARVTDFSFFAHFASSFESDVSKWSVGSVNDASWMFRAAKQFTSDVSGWDVSNIGNFTLMYVTSL